MKDDEKFPISTTQALLNGMSEAWQKERADTQMTLGDVIERLKELPPETKIKGLGDAHSYRGYYSDLSFEGESENAGTALKHCQESMGITFEGYKGGDYMMGSTTPVWIATYGCCGERLMEIKDDGTLVTASEED